MKLHTLAELDAEAERIAEVAYAADYDATNDIKELVRKAIASERAACLEICERFTARWDTADSCADAIRERGQE